jgi:hypothetical protein
LVGEEVGIDRSSQPVRASGCWAQGNDAARWVRAGGPVALAMCWAYAWEVWLRAEEKEGRGVMTAVSSLSGHRVGFPAREDGWFPSPWLAPTSRGGWWPPVWRAHRARVVLMRRSWAVWTPRPWWSAHHHYIRRSTDAPGLMELLLPQQLDYFECAAA